MSLIANSKTDSGVRRFASSSYGHRHRHRDHHHFLRTGLPRHHIQLVGKHSGVKYGRCQLRPLVDCFRREPFRKGAWRVLIEDLYMMESYKTHWMPNVSLVTPGVDRNIGGSNRHA
jgi:hypothetical protein